jgi:hypothetical protein
MKIFASLCIVLGAACSSYSPDLGYEPFSCGTSDPKCPEGYDCVPAGSAGQMECVQAGGSAPDAGSNNNGQCADDSNLEPNNDVAHAYIISALPVGGLKLAGLSICPLGDKDTYTLMASAGQTLQADLDFDPSQATLTVNLISSGGITTVPGQPNGSGMAKAALVGTQSGPQYVQVLVSPTAGTLTTNGNYKLTLTLN